MRRLNVQFTILLHDYVTLANQARRTDTDAFKDRVGQDRGVISIGSSELRELMEAARDSNHGRTFMVLKDVDKDNRAILQEVPRDAFADLQRKIEVMPELAFDPATTVPA